MTFESDEARRQYFLVQLWEKLPEFRNLPKDALSCAPRRRTAGYVPDPRKAADLDEWRIVLQEDPKLLMWYDQAQIRE